MGVPDIPLAPTHEVRLERRARFLLPACSCGWIGTARLAAASAREEARDHALLYAGLDVDPGQIAESASDDGEFSEGDAGDPAGRAPGE